MWQPRGHVAEFISLEMPLSLVQAAAGRSILLYTDVYVYKCIIVSGAGKPLKD